MDQRDRGGRQHQREHQERRDRVHQRGAMEPDIVTIGIGAKV
jgi:hypothetical protein